jgi:hypothetical protein
MRALFTLPLLALLPTLARAEAQGAKKLNAEGMNLYAKRRYDDALDRFQKAVAADPGFVLAHYNAASMASLLGKNNLVVKELEWLAASSDPVAKKSLAHARADKDLERASMHPRVRRLIGLPPIETTPPSDLLVERSGVWGSDGSYCGGDAYTFTFKKDGTLRVATQWACNDSEDEQEDGGTWSIVGGKVVLKSKKLLEKDTEPATFGPCDDKDAEPGFCLNFQVVTKSELGTLNCRRGAGSLH